MPRMDARKDQLKSDIKNLPGQFQNLPGIWTANDIPSLWNYQGQGNCICGPPESLYKG
jgi:hypothetical protein